MGDNAAKLYRPNVEQIIYILKKKQKNNPLLIGNAGVGKSAIIEGVCKELKNELIYELDLGSIVAGTKYRGELEEKLLKAMEFIESKKAIIFIEIAPAGVKNKQIKQNLSPPKQDRGREGWEGQAYSR